MSSHALTKIDQKEYLKKYLSGDKEKKKKKKDKKRKNTEKVKIIDDDINHLDYGLHIDEELLLTGDDAPQVVGEYIQETASESQIPKWKSFGVKEEPINVGISNKNNDRDYWGGRKKDDRFISNKLSKNQSPDNSPPRRKDGNRNSRSCSPPRKQHLNLPPRILKMEKTRTQNNYSDYSAGTETELKHRLDRSITRKSQIKRSPDRTSTSHRERLKSPDQSPSNRKDCRNSEYRSPHRKRRDLTDLSPIRRREPPDLKENSDQSSPGKANYLSDKEMKRFSDQKSSPQNRYSDQSPSRRGRDSVKSDRKRSLNQSPPRKGRRLSPAQSPLYRRRNSNLSPRWERNGVSTSREGQRSPNQSNLHRRRDSDQSPPRKSRNSPSGGRKRSPNKDGKSPTRGSSNLPLLHVKREKSSSDLSPVRYIKIKRESLSPPSSRTKKLSRWERQEPKKSVSPPPSHKHKATKTLEGKKAGLQDAHALHKESLERRKQENILFEKLSSDISGRNAEIQVRSTGRQGRRAREAKEEDPEERRRKVAHEEKKKQLYDRWGKGLKQIEDYKNRLAEQEHESNKPLARYSNDEDLERHLKEQERPDDPMLEYMRQKRKDKEKLSGKPQVPIYQGSFPENRFGIRPGYRWDGVDRSNGYERKYFDVQNEKRAQQDEAYKYSVEDM